MPNNEIRVMDSGTTFKKTILKTNGEAYPVNGYTVLQYKFQKPDGSMMVKDASLDEDDNVVYTTEYGDFDQVGTWKYQIYIERGSVKHHTDYERFRVHPNLPLA